MLQAADTWVTLAQCDIHVRQIHGTLDAIVLANEESIMNGRASRNRDWLVIAAAAHVCLDDFGLSRAEYCAGARVHLVSAPARTDRERIRVIQPKWAYFSR